ncbi:MAG: hypothetical protein J5530_00680, partial [Clostridia bacterium]|nr:hypothetical protein [Clostridia bacterium]
LWGCQERILYHIATTEQYIMPRGGFVPLDCEWWHFRLKDEPYPDTYFEFPVSSEYLRR